jgi:hypothetical protein
MYFDTKNYLKNIHNHTDKHAFSGLPWFEGCEEHFNKEI